MKDIMTLLFETDAFRVCEENKPFWYTSGKIGPYFINTHFLYGSESEANELLEFINNELANSKKEEIPKRVFEKTLRQYTKNKTYAQVVNSLIEKIKAEINIDEISYISGGERRDWLFSNIIAFLLDKPHISLFKDMYSVISDSNFEENVGEDYISGKVLHIADLVNQASSYSRYISIIDNLGGKIAWSVAVVDRMQGGTERLLDYDIQPISLFQIDKSLFENALKNNIITQEQLEMLNKYTDNPDESMNQFLKEHPEFLQDALKGDAKTAERAQKCINEGLYII